MDGLILSLLYFVVDDQRFTVIVESDAHICYRRILVEAAHVPARALLLAEHLPHLRGMGLLLPFSFQVHFLDTLLDP